MLSCLTIRQALLMEDTGAFSANFSGKLECSERWIVAFGIFMGFVDKKKTIEMTLALITQDPS